MHIDVGCNRAEYLADPRVSAACLTRCLSVPLTLLMFLSIVDFLSSRHLSSLTASHPPSPSLTIHHYQSSSPTTPHHPSLPSTLSHHLPPSLTISHLVSLSLTITHPLTPSLSLSQYMGLRQERDRSPAYDELIQEFFDACHDKYGKQVLMQFEDFGNSNAFRLLERHRHTACVFNDDIQVSSCRLETSIAVILSLSSCSSVSWTG